MQYDRNDPKHAAILGLHDEIRDRGTALAERGVQLEINGRSEVLLEFIADFCDDFSDRRLEMELQWARNCLGVIEQAEAQVEELEKQARQQRLTQGVALNPRVQNQLRR